MMGPQLDTITDAKSEVKEQNFKMRFWGWFADIFKDRKVLFAEWNRK